MRLPALGAALGALAVALGAFGAHVLRGRLAPDMLAVFDTAARYHLVHALALVVAGLAAGRPGGGAARAAAILFALGIALFSGSLYALALTGARAWGAVTPLGGLALIAGWIALAAGLARAGRESS